MRAFRYGMSGSRDRGTSFSLHDRFERDRSASLLGPSRRVAERTWHFELFISNQWGHFVLVRSLCPFLPLNDRNSFLWSYGKLIGKLSWKDTLKKKKINKVEIIYFYIFNIFNVSVVEEYICTYVATCDYRIFFFQCINHQVNVLSRIQYVTFLSRYINPVKSILSIRHPVSSKFFTIKVTIRRVAVQARGRGESRLFF